ncbi:unnamed protein product [Nezara viridula]|uniref:Uncharacterized protein n=1 Tax=Nezara viridula TaxID=85310 RepID=A0A9P0EGH2_NEZVI|nr:unnamed protein product [Nezara viridula]
MCSLRLQSLNRCLRKIQLVDHYLFSVGEQIPPSKQSQRVPLASVPTHDRRQFNGNYAKREYLLHYIPNE